MEPERERVLAPPSAQLLRAQGPVRQPRPGAGEEAVRPGEARPCSALWQRGAEGEGKGKEGRSAETCKRWRLRGEWQGVHGACWVCTCATPRLTSLLLALSMSLSSCSPSILCQPRPMRLMQRARRPSSRSRPCLSRMPPSTDAACCPGWRRGCSGRRPRRRELAGGCRLTPCDRAGAACCLRSQGLCWVHGRPCLLSWGKVGIRW